MRVTATATACWKDGKLILNIEETDDIRQRRYRAKEVVDTYGHQLIDGGVMFKGIIRVALADTYVGCTCPDLKHRLLPCKHVFAAAAVCGDAAAIASEPPPPKPVPQSGEIQPRRQRVQDIQVGRYFLLSDFLFSDTALREGIVNWVDWNSEYGAGVVQMMQILCDRLLDPLCDEFGRIAITRGYLGQQVYARLYPSDRDNWREGALAHGFQEAGGADIRIFQWQGSALELAKHIQAKPSVYQFDFIRVYPGSPILCTGVGRFKNRRNVLEWHPGFRGSTTHKP